MSGTRVLVAGTVLVCLAAVVGAVAADAEEKRRVTEGAPSWELVIPPLADGPTLYRTPMSGGWVVAVGYADHVGVTWVPDAAAIASAERAR